VASDRRTSDPAPRLDYRVVLHDGIWAPARVDAAYDACPRVGDGGGHGVER